MKKKVFISYCHSQQAMAIVKQLVNALKRRRIEVVYDANVQLGQHLTPFMERIQDPSIEKVLCVVDKKYAERANLRKGGVGKESCIITQTVYETNQTRIIPIFCNKNRKGEFYAPVFLKDVKGVDFTTTTKRKLGTHEIVAAIEGRSTNELNAKKKSPHKDERMLVMSYNHSDCALTICNISRKILDDVRLSMDPNLLYENQGENDDETIEVGVMLPGDKRVYGAGWQFGDDPKITHCCVECRFKHYGKSYKESIQVRI